MQNLLTVAQQVAILFVLMGAGAVMRRAKFFKDAAIDGIVNVLILVVTPCLIVDVFQRPFDPSMLTSLGIAFLVAAVGHLLVIVVAFLFVHAKDEDVRIPLRLSAIFSNAGFMGIPLDQAILGDRGVFYGAVYIVVFNLVMWSWGYRRMARTERRASRSWLNLKSFVNPGTVGLGLGLSLFFLSVKMPDMLSVPIHQMAAMNTPLAMIVIGYYLAGAKLGRVVRMANVYVASFIRLLGYPLMMVAIMYPFRHQLDRDMMLATVIASAAPVAAMVSMIAAKFDRDVDVAVGIVSGTTLLSILTMPVVIAFAMGVL